MRRLLALLLVPVAGLAGCADDPGAPGQAGSPFPEPEFEPYQDPNGEFFADSRHCYAYDVYTHMLGSDLAPLVPPGWTFANPVAPEVRVVLHRCIEDFAVLVAVPMHAGPTAASPRVDFVLEVFTNTTEDDWAQLGAPVRRATTTLEPMPNGREMWRTTSDQGLAVLIDMMGKGSQMLGQVQMHEYAGGPQQVRSWAEEHASLSRPVEAQVDFGAGSVLAQAREGPDSYPGILSEASPNRWLGAFNAEFRPGSPP